MLLSRREVLQAALASGITSSHAKLNPVTTPVLSSGTPSLATAPQAKRVYEALVIADNDSRTLNSRGAYTSYLAQLRVAATARSSNVPSSYHLETAPVQEAFQPDAGPLSVPAPYTEISSRFQFGNHGSEFSDLLLLPGSNQLLTFGDHTGIVFEVQACGALQELLTGPQSNTCPASTPAPIAPSAEQPAVPAFTGASSAPPLLQQLPSSSSPSSALSPSPRVVPRWVLADGDGMSDKAFKAEWAAWKDGYVYVGSHGYALKPKVRAARATSCPSANPPGRQWVKRLDPLTGTITHENWAPLYETIRSALGCNPDGYVTHEACTWSSTHQRWFFMPRRVSTTPYASAEVDARKGANLLVSVNADGTDVQVTKISGQTDPLRGYSAMRFLPGTEDQHIMALKTVEAPDQPFETYISVVDVNGQDAINHSPLLASAHLLSFHEKGKAAMGKMAIHHAFLLLRVLLSETLISRSCKFEGLEVISATGCEENLTLPWDLEQIDALRA